MDMESSGNAMNIYWHHERTKAADYVLLESILPKKQSETSILGRDMMLRLHSTLL